MRRRAGAETVPKFSSIALRESGQVLSACDLGRATVLHGEESVGMSAAWLHAGARAVISSPALLADELACEVFADWHARVAAGEAPADALAGVTSSAEEIVPLLTFGAGW